MPAYSFQLSAHLAGRAVSVVAAGSSTVVASGTLDASAKFAADLPVGDYVAAAGDGHYAYQAAGTVDQGDSDRLADGALNSTFARVGRTAHEVPVVDYRARSNDGGQSNGTDLGANYRYRHTTVASSGGLRIAYGNWQGQGGVEVNGPNDITVRAAVENSAGAIIPVFFGGKRDITLNPGATAWSDPVGLDVAKAEVFYTRTYVTVASAGQKWPRQITTDNTFGEGVVRSATPTDLTTSGTITAAYESGFGPVAIRGLPRDPALSVVGIVGDSIAAGTGEDAAHQQDKGFLTRGINNTVAYQQTAYPSGTAGSWTAASLGQHYRRSPLLDRCSHIICELGINDLGGTLANVQSGLIAAWKLLAAKRAAVYQTTITPYTTSTDAWATTANQTPTANESKRLTLNGWIRDGAPMLNGAAVATGSNAAGTVRAGQVGHPLAGFIEVADVAEGTRDSGKWTPGWTADGLHPNSTGHAALAAPIATFVAGLTPAT